jgi:hypothetical protein
VANDDCVVEQKLSNLRPVNHNTFIQIPHLLIQSNPN